MNRRTFSDAVKSKVSSLANDIDDDEDDEQVGIFRGNIEGEEDGCEESYNDVGDEFEPFNLKSDRKLGYFDDNMNFVFKKEEQEVDNWLADFDESKMEKAIGEAAVAKKKHLNLIQEKKVDHYVKKSYEDIVEEIIHILLPKETIKKAMNRLSGRNKMNIPMKADEKLKCKQQLDKLTELSDDLISFGYSDVFDLSRESIDAGMYEWEYKGLDGVIHGPFSSNQIADWKIHGYFTGDSAVLMRKVISYDKKRVHFHDSSNSNKKPKLENISTKDLIDDLEDDELEPQEPIENHISLENPWIISDDIDFGKPREIESLKFKTEVVTETRDRKNDNDNDSDEDDDDIDHDEGEINRRSRKQEWNQDNEEDD